MKLARYLIVAIAVLWIPFARCQTADTALAELQNKTKGHKYVLRTFSAQPITLYHVSGDRLEPDSSPLVKAVALFSPTDLTLSGTILTMRGLRYGLLLDRSFWWSLLKDVDRQNGVPGCDVMGAVYLHRVAAFLVHAAVRTSLEKSLPPLGMYWGRSCANCGLRR